MWQFIKKFGPEYSDLPTMVWNVNFLMRALGLNICGSYKNPIPLFTYILTSVCVACYYYCYIFSMLWFVLLRPTDNLAAAMVFGSLAISSHIAAMKLFYMMFNKSKVQCLVKQCLDNDALTVPYSRFSQNLTNVLRIVKKRAIFFWLTIMIISVLYLNIPAFLPGKHLPEDLIEFYGLKPKYETPYYEITYLVSVISVVFICYVTSTVIVFICVLVGYIEAQMTTLSEEIIHLWDDSILNTLDFKIEHLMSYQTDDEATVSKINSDLKKRLVSIMQIHNRNITLLNNLNEFYNVPNALAFASLGASLIAELLGGLESTYLQIPFTFSQVVMDCYAGQKVIDASLKFERAVYGCKWEKFDVSNKKIVLMMLQNSQRTMQLSAGGMTVLNFACLQSIMKSVYSAYTTLRSILK